MGITKFVLRKPVTTLLFLLSVVFFGIVSLAQFKYELIPDIDMPMYIVVTPYPGASPEDVDSLVTKKIEEQAYNLQGAKDITCVSRENASMVIIQYNYGQNMDVAYNDLKKMIDTVKKDFNESVNDPYVLEMDINTIPVMRMAVRNESTTDIYNYVTNTFVKEIEKISEVSSVDVYGGQESYIKIELLPDQLARYNLAMNTVAQIVTAADFSYPAGSIVFGNQELSMTTKVEYDTIDSLKTIPIITGNKRTLYLEDIANIYETKKEAETIGRYNGEDCMVVAVQKVQSASSVTASKNILKAVEKLKESDPNLIVSIVTDQADNINASINNVFQTMIIAIALSMFVLFIFLGDIKGSLIIGTSIPFSILTSLVLMYLAGYTLNLITISALVLGVGMMVDNSICVLEQCFRSKEMYGDKNVKSYIKTAISATNIIGFSVFGSTLTTIVVFAPLGFLQGMSGQFFKPLGFTIVFCMLASFVSAITIVPLTYVFWKPEEKATAPIAGIVTYVQNWYRHLMPKFLRHKWLVSIVSIIILIFGFSLLPTFKTELVAPTDEGMISIDISTKPGLKLEEANKIYKTFEEFVMNQEDVENYVLSNSTGGVSLNASTDGQKLIAFLRENRRKTTKQLVREWNNELSSVTDCSFSIDSYSTSFTSTFVVNSDNKLDLFLESTDYDDLKAVNDRIVKLLEQRNDVASITTSLDNAAPTIQATIDPILAASEGFTPAQVGGLLYNMLSGKELYDMKVDDNTYTIYLEYPNDEYNNIDKIEGIELTSTSGTKTTLKDIATITVEDSPASIRKYNKRYRDEITAKFNTNYTENSETEIIDTIIKPNLTQNVVIGESTVDEMLGEEFGALFIAIGVAIFLVFIVMASQFESVRYSLMVMGTILYSFAGAFFALWLSGLKLQMVALLGFMMLVGTAVNNGILYVDTVNQYIDGGMETEKAIVESGAIRMRPILMTTLTTIVSMIPMSMAYGKNGEILQGLGVANLGGLILSTLMAFFVLPVLYFIFSHRKGDSVEQLAKDTKVALNEMAVEENR